MAAKRGQPVPPGPMAHVPIPGQIELLFIDSDRDRALLSLGETFVELGSDAEPRPWTPGEPPKSELELPDRTVRLFQFAEER